MKFLASVRSSVWLSLMVLLTGSARAPADPVASCYSDYWLLIILLMHAGVVSAQLDEHAFVPCTSFKDEALAYVQVDSAQGIVSVQNISLCGLLNAGPYSLQNATVALLVNSTNQDGRLQSSTFSASLAPDPLLAVNATTSVTNVTESDASALVTVAPGSIAPTLYQSSAGSLLLTSLPANSQLQSALQPVPGAPADTTDCPNISSTCA